ncbi:MAG TPA: BPSL0067 family protein [Caulobacteraceae bacterium]|nr:BPSL0067 family protein [Caulobacteraceae bacterium]
MAYVATNYLLNTAAPLKQWACTRTSTLGPFASPPAQGTTGNPDFCGQCVSYVTTVCPAIPVNTGLWKKGVQVKVATGLKAGAAIATFDASGKYSGHAAIYESQDRLGINVVDQWVTPPATPIHKRTLRFGAHGNSNNGDNFYVIE